MLCMKLEYIYPTISFVSHNVSDNMELTKAKLMNSHIFVSITKTCCKHQNYEKKQDIVFVFLVDI